ncbi:hypothetical protein HOLleu_11729 [Holothuria leucospilota]|uniref:CCHC-type domain-containing protein n=1 Tax=Holothuria leucospilota TaxID=206669 RepID=A0A9Q1CF60_HOLLE|nr:hypothetical protein HOLleu_11729 [Holothuria leucospilota]
MFAENGGSKSTRVEQTKWRVCEDQIWLTSRHHYAEVDGCDFWGKSSLPREEASTGSRNGVPGKQTNKGNIRWSQANERQHLSKLSPTNPFRTDVGLEWYESREQLESRKSESRRSTNFTEGKAIKSESETTGLCMTATEGIIQCRLSMAELQSEIKAVRSELQLMKDERKQYSSQEKQGRGNPAYMKDGTPICFKCRKPGHVKRNCPEKIGTAAEQSEVASGNDQLSGMGVARRQ